MNLNKVQSSCTGKLQVQKAEMKSVTERVSLGKATAVDLIPSVIEKLVTVI